MDDAHLDSPEPHAHEALLARFRHQLLEALRRANGLLAVLLRVCYPDVERLVQRREGTTEEPRGELLSRP
eukprot:scaffold7075_cov274-Pinguiococcus_pyrenoidosus.AAC.24